MLLYIVSLLIQTIRLLMCIKHVLVTKQLLLWLMMCMQWMTKLSVIRSG